MSNYLIISARIPDGAPLHELLQLLAGLNATDIKIQSNSAPKAIRPRVGPNQQKIVDKLKETPKASFSQIVAGVGLTSKQVSNALTHLTSKKAIFRDSRGNYQITD